MYLKLQFQTGKAETLDCMCAKQHKKENRDPSTKGSDQSHSSCATCNCECWWTNKQLLKRRSSKYVSIRKDSRVCLRVPKTKLKHDKLHTILTWKYIVVPSSLLRPSVHILKKKRIYEKKTNTCGVRHHLL